MIMMKFLLRFAKMIKTETKKKKNKSDITVWCGDRE